ncbi:type II toxin-antitoxin system VapC family toxin [Microlunatus ginsengisoli]|uniref:Ribonuclease VapC n=1 Tax=Microlunatus ginsengisoli TaxID=363863 RepID=A0ABP7ANC7_9ACTN
MILIDTSAWVDYLRGDATPATAAVRRLVSDTPDDLVMTEPVAMELLAGARDDVTLARMERLTTGLPGLRVAADLDFRSAAALYRGARRAGETVRSMVDCLIAAIAARHGALVVHKDQDFEALGRLGLIDERSYRLGQAG